VGVARDVLPDASRAPPARSDRCALSANSRHSDRYWL